MKYEFIVYDDEKHRNQFYDLNYEYLTFVVTENKIAYGIDVIPDGGKVEDYLKQVFGKFTEIKPPKGVIYILEKDGLVEGMGVLREIDDAIGEIKRMYIKPKSQGKGFGKELYDLLEEKARVFGFKKLRLDTADIAHAALHIYRKNGFVEIENYSGGEWDNRSDVEGILIYMEKEL